MLSVVWLSLPLQIRESPVRRPIACARINSTKPNSPKRPPNSKLSNAKHARRLIEAGALIEKVGLFDLDANVLYGALLSLRDSADDTH
jgi:hypothetical protein